MVGDGLTARAPNFVNHLLGRQLIQAFAAHCGTEVIDDHLGPKLGK
jgi:hypothetical protein